MKNLIIVGAGGFGREVYCWATQSPSFEKDWNIKGFLDDDRKLLGKKIHGVPVIGTIKEYQITEHDVFTCAIGDPLTKKRVCEYLLGKGGFFGNIIHPSVVIGGRVNMGQGIILCPHVVLTCDITIGDFVSINLACTVGHDSEVGKWTTVSPNCNIAGGSKLGEGVFFGSNVTILPKAQIGDFSIVGAGSVVLKRVDANKTVFGIPAFEVPRVDPRGQK